MNVNGKKKKNQAVTENIFEQQELLKKSGGDQRESHSFNMA